MIVSFRGKFAEHVLSGTAPKGLPPTLVRPAQRKLFMVEHALELKDLLSPPGNRLEALKGDRAGQYSIRINEQWRICFRWEGGNAHDVEIVNYH